LAGDVIFDSRPAPQWRWHFIETPRTTWLRPDTPNGSGIFFVNLEKKHHMDENFIEAINATADTSFDVTSPLIAERRSRSAREGFYRPGERSEDGAPFKVTPTKCPPYLGPSSGRIPTADEKRGAWQLEEEYLAGRLGKNAEENSRNWNTVKWINRHYAVTKTPAGALPPLNIYVGDKTSQSTEGTGAPAGPDDEAPDEAGNEGIEFESINVGEADGRSSMCVMDEDGTTRRLDIKTEDYAVLRLIDDLEEIDKLAKIDVDDLVRKAAPAPQVDFPSSDDREESGKIIRILMVGMHTLWHPIIRAIADHATMKSLGKSQGVSASG
jgi:hypothetical protein